MRDLDEFDRIFKMLNDMMDTNWSGGYRTSQDHPNENLDLQEDRNHIYFSMELKVRDEDIQVTPLPESINIELMLDGIWRKKTIRLPCRVNPKTAKISFNNYVLDVELEKIKDDNGINRKDR